MKKLLSLLIIGLITMSNSFAQRNNIDPKIQAERDMMAIERKMINENTDEEGVKLINEHTAAKKKLDANMKKISGYGEAATDKNSLEKFREKNAKKDPEFAKLSEQEKSTRKAKEDYIANANPKYKELKQTSSN